MEAPENISSEVWVLLNRTRHLIYKARQKELNQYGISVRNAAILNTVFKLGKQATPGQIARQLFLEQHSVSETLSRMEARGLIKKIKDLPRKNLIRVEITDSGYEVYQKSIRRKSINTIMAALSQEEKLKLKSLLLKVRDKVLEQLGLDQTGVYPPSGPGGL